MLDFFMAENKISSRRDSNFFVLTAVNIGGTLEWFEIGIFFAWQLIIQQNAISFDVLVESLNVGAVLIVAIMAVASGGARAIGGWFFGKKGDQQGRRIAFPLTILVATLPSWGLVFLSFFLSYETWITYSTIIFTLVKFFQGMPAGGELPGAICYLAEATENSQGKLSWIKRRYMCSYAMLGPQIGLALSTLFCLILKLLFPVDILLSHGWRFVFLVSGILGIGGFMMRKKLHETVAFLKRKIHHKIGYSPLKIVFNVYRTHLIFGSLLSVFEVVAFSVLSVIPLYYLGEPFNFTQEKIVFISFGFSALCIIFLPLIGYFSSKYANFPWLKVSAWAVIFLSFFLYKSLLKGSFLTSLLINIAMIFLFSIQASILPSILAGLFPVHVRYTGVAFSFNICDGVLWTAISSTCFLSMSNNNPAFVFFLPIAAGIFLITLCFKRMQGDLSRQLR
jgi:MHS family proline/betaine transporter-like MFS transporter